MSHTPNFDAKIKTILDALVPGERTCALTGDKWIMDETEIAWLKKFHVPPPTWAPMNRLKVIAGFATGYGWWWQKHPKTGERVLTYVHPATGIKVLPDPEFYEQDNTDKGRVYTNDRSFFDQMRELQLEVPFTAWRSLTVPENSISLLSQGDTNSYFVTGCSSKNTVYSYCAEMTENSAEIYESTHVTSSYNVLNSHRLHNCKFVRQSYDCINSSFLFDCRNCENCFGATNKRNAKYLWFNEQLSQSEWEQRRAEVDLGSRQTLDDMLARFRMMMEKEAVWPENFNELTEACTGEFLTKSEDCKECFFVKDSKHNFWLSYGLGICEGNAYLAGAGESTNNFYSHAPFKSSGCKYVHSCYACQNLEYCMQCYNCEDCFGCVGLIRKRFCIFNKQYSEEDYWATLDQIKCRMLERGEYGDFFPAHFSPSYFFASPALAFLVDNEEAKKLGVALYDLDSEGARGNSDPAAPVKAISELPDHIKDIASEVWGGVQFLDVAEGRRFNYIKPELELYKRLGIAPPIQSGMRRLRSLVEEANSAIPMEAVCAKTGKKLRVAKNKAYPTRTIYCREAYLQYLEGKG